MSYLLKWEKIKIYKFILILEGVLCKNANFHTLFSLINFIYIVPVFGEQ